GTSARNIAHQLQIFVPDRVRSVSHGHLIKHPLIDGASLWHGVRVFVRDERFAEKFPHSSVNFPRSKITIVQKDLQPRGGFLVIIRQRDGIHRGRRSCFLLRWQGVLLRQRELCDCDDPKNTKNELHWRKLCAANQTVQTRSCFPYPGGVSVSSDSVSASAGQPIRPRVTAMRTN